jgi:hypothetical protein
MAGEQPTERCTCWLADATSASKMHVPCDAHETPSTPRETHIHDSHARLVHKTSAQDSYTRLIHKTYTQDLHTRLTHKTLTQDVQRTRLTHTT